MEIKIVTAFFDIGRGESKYLSRSNKKYFEYFTFWASIQNDLTVYCQTKNAQEIMNIRRRYGLEDKTHIKTIDDFFNIEIDIYQKMKDIENNHSFKNFRFFNNALSNTADYCYIMALKWWCLKDAAKLEKSTQMMAWLDFGYNHGGELYVNPRDFNFLWDYDFDEKINCFCLSDPDSVSAIDSLQFQSDCFIGHTAIMPAHYCELFWNEIKNSLVSLLSLDCMDDDQQLELMVYKKHPEWFKIRICNWFEDMVFCGGKSFEVRKEKRTPSIKVRTRYYMEKAKRMSSFKKRTKKRCIIYGR